MVTDSTIRFLLDDRIVEISACDPTRSVLQYLREDLQRCGSKEGCAEGDCGACTVVVGEAVDGRLQLRSVNACLMLLPMLHGKMLLTVESLQAGYPELHPVQQAMVDCHGSQCGFCTPGFVMSLFALYKSHLHPDRDQINDALSGNLCRCTGYRPIIEAAGRMHDLADGDGPPWLYWGQDDDPQIQILLNQLDQIRPRQMLAMEHDGIRLFAPIAIYELNMLKQKYPQATLVAGNTDVGLWINKQLRTLPVLIYLGLLDDLKSLDVSDDAIHIGAGVSLTDAFELLTGYFPALRDLTRQFASLPIRNAGTLGGNVANGSPIGDSMPALLALDAEVVLQGAQGRCQRPLHEFYLGYQKKAMAEEEWVEAIVIPRKPVDSGFKIASYKVSKRFDQDISAVCAAFALQLDGEGRIAHIRIAYGGMAAIPRRAVRTENRLLGESWDETALDSAAQALAEDFSPLSDMRASAGYRLKLAQNLLRRFYLESSDTGQAYPTRLLQLAEVSA